VNADAERKSQAYLPVQTKLTHMWPFHKKSWMERKMDALHRGGPATMFSWALAKFLVGAGVGVLLASYFPNAPRDGWEIWGWTLVLFAIIVCIPAWKAMFTKK